MHMLLICKREQQGIPTSKTLYRNIDKKESQRSRHFFPFCRTRFPLVPQQTGVPSPSPPFACTIQKALLLCRRIKCRLLCLFFLHLGFAKNRLCARIGHAWKEARINDLFFLSLFLISRPVAIRRQRQTGGHPDGKKSRCRTFFSFFPDSPLLHCLSGARFGGRGENMTLAAVGAMSPWRSVSFEVAPHVVV